MSVNIQTPNGLVKVSGDKVTKKKVVDALGYTPANEENHYTKEEINNNFDNVVSIEAESDNITIGVIKQIINAYQDGKVVSLKVNNSANTRYQMWTVGAIDTAGNGDLMVSVVSSLNGLVTATYYIAKEHLTDDTIDHNVVNPIFRHYFTDTENSNKYAAKEHTHDAYADADHNHDSSYYKKTETYTRREVDQQVNNNNQYLLGEVDTKFNDYYNQGEVDNEIATAYDNVLAEVDTKIQNRTGKVVVIDVETQNITVGHMKLIYDEYINGNTVVIHHNKYTLASEVQRVIDTNTNITTLYMYVVTAAWGVLEYSCTTNKSDDSLASTRVISPNLDDRYYQKTETYSKTEVDTLFSGYYDSEEVDNKIAEAATGGNVDLSNYATKEELATKVEPFILEVTGVDVITVAQGIQIYNAFHAGQPTIIRLVDADGVFDMNIIVQAAFCIMSASYAIVACAGNEMFALEFEYTGDNDNDIVSDYYNILITQEDLESYLESYADKDHNHDDKYALKTEIPSLGDYYTSGEVDAEIADQIATEKTTILEEVDTKIENRTGKVVCFEVGSLTSLTVGQVKQIYNSYINGNAVTIINNGADYSKIVKRIYGSVTYVFYNSDRDRIDLYISSESPLDYHMVSCYMTDDDSKTATWVSSGSHNHDGIYYQKSETYSKTEVDNKISELEPVIIEKICDSTDEALAALEITIAEGIQLYNATKEGRPAIVRLTSPDTASLKTVIEIEFTSAMIAQDMLYQIEGIFGTIIVFLYFYIFDGVDTNTDLCELEFNDLSKTYATIEHTHSIDDIEPMGDQNIADPCNYILVSPGGGQKAQWIENRTADRNHNHDNTYAAKDHNHDSSYYKKTETYTRQEVDQQVNENNQYLLGEVDNKFNDYYNQSEVDSEIADTYDNVLKEVDNKLINYSPKKTTSTLYSTQTTVYTPSSAKGTVVTVTTNLSGTFQVGDRIKAYYSGGSSYPTCQSGVIEFELCASSSNTIVGRGSFVSTLGSQALLIGAEFVSNTVSGSTTTRLISSVYTLSDINTGTSNYSSKAYVYLTKIELIR